MFTDNVTGRVMKLRSRDQCQINGITVNVVDLFSEDEKVDVNEQVLSKGLPVIKLNMTFNAVKSWFHHQACTFPVLLVLIRFILFSS